MAEDDEIRRVPGYFEYPAGLAPDKSRKTPGAWRANLRDDEGHLESQAEFIPNPEAVGDQIAWDLPQYEIRRQHELTPEQEERARAIGRFFAQVVLELGDKAWQAAKPRLTSWWNDIATPAINSAAESGKRRVAKLLRREPRAALDADQPPGGELAEPAPTMTGDEARSRLLAARLARAFCEEQLRHVGAAKVVDEDGGPVTQQELEDQVIHLLEANPGLLDSISDMLGAGRPQTIRAIGDQELA